MRTPSPAAIAYGRRMNDPVSDALVLFGATGDLAYQKIFPALQALSRTLAPSPLQAALAKMAARHGKPSD